MFYSAAARSETDKSDDLIDLDDLYYDFTYQILILWVNSDSNMADG